MTGTTDRRVIVVESLVLPGWGDVVVVRAGPKAPWHGAPRWQREVQILVDEVTRKAEVWVDGVAVQ